MYCIEASRVTMYCTVASMGNSVLYSGKQGKQYNVQRQPGVTTDCTVGCNKALNN